jgi:hypothetical protein
VIPEALSKALPLARLPVKARRTICDYQHFVNVIELEDSAIEVDWDGKDRVVSDLFQGM